MAIDELTGEGKWKLAEETELERLSELHGTAYKWTYDIKHDGKYKSRFVGFDNTDHPEESDSEDSDGSPPPLLGRDDQDDSSSSDEGSGEQPPPLATIDPYTPDADTERKARAEASFYEYDAILRRIERQRPYMEDNNLSGEFPKDWQDPDSNFQKFPSTWRDMEPDFQKGDW